MPMIRRHQQVLLDLDIHELLRCVRRLRLQQRIAWSRSPPHGRPRAIMYSQFMQVYGARTADVEGP